VVVLSLLSALAGADVEGDVLQPLPQHLPSVEELIFYLSLPPCLPNIVKLLHLPRFLDSKAGRIRWKTKAEDNNMCWMGEVRHPPSNWTMTTMAAWRCHRVASAPLKNNEKLSNGVKWKTIL
jgi:hypothetical protein